MAIGDTVQAGLMRVDTTPLLQAQIRSSEQMGNAIAGLGRDIGSGIQKFMQNKKEGEAADMQIGALLQNMSPERQQEIQSGEGELGKSLSKFLSGELGNSKKKALLGSLMTINTADQLNRKEAMDAERFKQQQEINNLNRLIAQEKIDDRLSDRQATDTFITKLYSQAPTGKLNEAGQDDLERGLAFLAPGPQAREKYKNRLLQDPQFQQTEPVMGMTGNRFIQQFAGESPAVQERALAFMQAEQKRRAEKATAGMEDFATLRKAEADMRKEFNALDATKDFGDVRTAFLKVKTAAENPSAAGDLALVFNYMKILDPGSVVREGEFQTAADATSWLQRTEDNGFAVPLPIAKAIRKLEDGTLLTPNQRQDFLSTARNTASAQFKPAKEALQRYKGLAANSGLRADQIIPSNYLQIEEELSPSKPQGPGIDTKQGTYRIPGLSVEAQ